MSQQIHEAQSRSLLNSENEQIWLTENKAGKVPLWVKIGDYVLSHSRTPKLVNKRTYLILALSCGWLCGAHRWYAGEKRVAIMYLLTCWTGIAAAMTIIDLFLLWAKYEADENGMILM